MEKLTLVSLCSLSLVLPIVITFSTDGPFMFLSDT